MTHVVETVDEVATAVVEEVSVDELEKEGVREDEVVADSELWASVLDEVVLVGSCVETKDEVVDVVASL